MKNSDKFVDYYNKIDAFLEQDGGFRNHESFTKKVRMSKNKIVDRFKDELISMGELRNAIVHNPKIGEEAIAEPHESIVKRIEQIYKILSNPQKVSPKFKFKVIGTKKEDLLIDLLKLMKPRSISQVPVYDDNHKVIEILNTNTITRWLANQLKANSTIDFKEVRIKELLPEIEYPKNYLFIAEKASLIAAQDMFLEYIKKYKRNLDAVFITPNGKEHENIMGMIAIEDIADTE